MIAARPGTGTGTGTRRRSGPRSLLLSAAAGLLALGLLAPALQAQVNPFGTSPGGMTEAQSKAMGKAIEAALAADKPGVTETWSADGSGGTVTVEKLFQKNGLSCVLLSHAFNDEDRIPYKLPFCDTDKGWKVYF
ncbi:hypothetical protein ACFOGJ_13525 [Marinibaculum pumilum]|uniref:Surface antigen domain-containing protein n=1 Tax=Marinibaculum pumilum TaxID=1766165 RepID=A0ABV7L0Y7_9PROT